MATRKKTKGRKASKRKTTARKAPRRVVKVARKVKHRKSVGFAAMRPKPRKTTNGMNTKKIMGRVTDAALIGGGVLAGNYLAAKLAAKVPNPWVRNGILVAGGVLLGGMMPALSALGNGLAAAGVAQAAAPLLLPAGGGAPAANRRTVGALTAAEQRMIEAAAKGMPTNGTSPQSEVLTGLYDTANALV